MIPKHPAIYHVLRQSCWKNRNCLTVLAVAGNVVACPASSQAHQLLTAQMWLDTDQIQHE